LHSSALSMVFSDLACAGDVGNLIIALVPPPQKARLDLLAPEGGRRFAC
jgi:hypothetical protein